MLDGLVTCYHPERLKSMASILFDLLPRFFRVNTELIEMNISEEELMTKRIPLAENFVDEVKSIRVDVRTSASTTLCADVSYHETQGR